MNTDLLCWGFGPTTAVLMAGSTAVVPRHPLTSREEEDKKASPHGEVWTGLWRLFGAIMMPVCKPLGMFMQKNTAIHL